MPKKGQKNLTIQKWVWDLAVEYYEANKEELRLDGINSPTALIVRQFLQVYKDAQAAKEETAV